MFIIVCSWRVFTNCDIVRSTDVGSSEKSKYHYVRYCCIVNLIVRGASYGIAPQSRQRHQN